MPDLGLSHGNARWCIHRFCPWGAPRQLPDNSCAEARMRLEDGKCLVTGQVMGLAKGMGHVPDRSVRGTVSCLLSSKSKKGTPTLTWFRVMTLTRWSCPWPTESMLLTCLLPLWVLQLLPVIILPPPGCRDIYSRKESWIIWSHPCNFQQRTLRPERGRDLLKVT